MIKTKRQAPQIKALFDKDKKVKTVAVRTIKRSDPDTTKALGHAGVSTVHEAQGRIAHEDAKRVKLAAGELGIDIYNMRPGLAEAGFHYVETLDDLGEFNGIDCRNRD